MTEKAKKKSKAVENVRDFLVRTRRSRVSSRFDLRNGQKLDEENLHVASHECNHYVHVLPTLPRRNHPFPIHTTRNCPLLRNIHLHMCSSVSTFRREWHLVWSGTANARSYQWPVQSANVGRRSIKWRHIFNDKRFFYREIRYLECRTREEFRLGSVSMTNVLAMKTSQF